MLPHAKSWRRVALRSMRSRTSPAGDSSRDNLKYWSREPYIGFGVDAHSMLLSVLPEAEAVRFRTPAGLDSYMGGLPIETTIVTRENALEEVFFLGLRLNRGVDLREDAEKFGCESVARIFP